MTQPKNQEMTTVDLTDLIEAKRLVDVVAEADGDLPAEIRFKSAQALCRSISEKIAPYINHPRSAPSVDLQKVRDVVADVLSIVRNGEPCWFGEIHGRHKIDIADATIDRLAEALAILDSAGETKA